jgi:WD40 repeat protein
LLSLKNGFLAIGTNEKIVIYDTIKRVDIKYLKGYYWDINYLMEMKDGRIVGTSQDRNIYIWNYTSGQIKTKLSLGSSYDFCNTIQISHDLLVSCSSWLLISIWNVTTGQIVKSLQGHELYVTYIEMLPNGNLISGSYDKTIRVWNMTTGQMLLSIQGLTDFIRCLLLLNNGLVASGEDTPIINIWNTESGILENYLIGHVSAVRCMILLKKDHMASGSHDSTVRIWNYATGHLIKTFTYTGGARIWSLAFILPNETLASCGIDDGSLIIWNLPAVFEYPKLWDGIGRG